MLDLIDTEGESIEMGNINIQIRDSTLSGTKDMDAEAARKANDSLQSTEISRP
jgi:hypothetical protein